MDTAVAGACGAFKPPKRVSIALPQGDTAGSTPSSLNQEDDADASSNFDAVAWPTNRCCYEELTCAELAAIEQLFASRDDTPALLKWVVVHSPSQRKFAKRLLVLSSSRVALVKRRQTPFTRSLVVANEHQLLHLDAIRVLLLRSTTTLQASDPSAVAVSIAMQFHSSSHHHDRDAEDSSDRRPRKDDDRLEIHFDPGIHAETIVRLCQRKLHAMRLVFPGQRLPRLALPPPCPWHEFFTVQDTPPSQAYGDALATAYQCFCDDLGVPYRASVALRLRECLASACVDVQYCLATSPLHPQSAHVVPARHDDPSRGTTMLAAVARFLGMHTFSVSTWQAKEVLALARTLAHGQCFREIVVDDVRMTNAALQALFRALLPGASPPTETAAIQGLSLTNVGLTTASLRALQHTVLQSSLRQSPASPSAAFPLRRLDLSFNDLSNLMALALATTLSLLPSGLDVLVLEQCRLSMAASARLLSAMKSSHGFSSSLRELNLSGNTLGAAGTRMLSVWITGAFALRRLDLSRTRLQTEAFVRAFAQNSILHESSLQALDLSYNHLSTRASAALGDIVGKTQSLATLVLRGMAPPRLHPRRLLNGLLRVKKSRTRRTTTHGLTTVHLRNIVGPMLQNSARACPCQLDLSENDLGSANAAALAHLVDSAPTATLASLRLDDTALSDKSAVLLLHSLRASKTLASLSLEGNGFTRRRTKHSYARFHGASKPRVPTAIERAAADALSLLLGGKTTERDEHDADSGHCFTHLYHHRPKRVPLRELSLRARGRAVFGECVLTTAVRALAVNTSLRMLDVSGNECGDALARALGAVLPENKTLQVLYWDDNFTTVDGFLAFYDGLLRNQTLSVVQLPINDTRRILEEQKDPPREKLFSVLGKIFKVTERNQALAHAARDHPKRQQGKQPKSPRRKQHEQQSSVDNLSAKSLEQIEPEETQDEPAITPTAALDVDVSLDETPLDAAEATPWTGRFATTRTRYPTTIQSWSRDGTVTSGDDVRASWDQIGSLASMLT